MPPRIFNDVHFQHWEPPVLGDTTWGLFPRLPPELRLHVWLVYLRRYRMIELNICRAADEDATTYPGNGFHSRYYTNRNAYGNIVSGRDYMLSWNGRRRGHPGSYSPLLWVNQESRRATLVFYRVKLPFFGLLREQVLYLNPEYDVVSIHPRWDQVGSADFDPLTLLADLLHDVKAYDRMGQGVAHLALNKDFFWLNMMGFGSLPFQLTPDALHPVAAASFTDILRRRLRSVLFVIRFRSCYRGLGEFPARQGYQYHFAQTFPLGRRNHPAGAFHWLDADPRPGVDIDIRQLPLGGDPRVLGRGWKQLEQAFGVTRPAQDQQHDGEARGEGGNAGLRLYVCPRVTWPKYERADLLALNIAATQPQEGHSEEEDDEEGPRADLARHLRSFPNDPLVPVPRHGDVVDAEMFARMERLPCTAIGMWLFPAEAFNEPTVPHRSCFDASAVRPGLILFDL
ncbi:uncharacterized protein B0H64DRAFT_405422 [Chaetomium fimeti]|uniref:2EXR domain-containing protein n=1 Tax=Chaetomium fimeti TaxID=1854472 RepID=A0AAE0LQQ1_9PEZI|nr:hypothetical protein B0H64DRAFT_405422 [Chaetomium fimeti]